MADKIFIGNFPQGLTQDRLPFFIDNNSFPTMFNFYTWRGRARRKRGTSFLGRGQVFFSSQSAGSVTLPAATYALFANITLYTTSVPTSVKISTAQPGANIAPGTASLPLVITIGSQTLTDTTGSGIFVITGSGTISAASIQYGTGILSLTGGTGTEAVVIVSGSYFPGLPSLGLEDYIPPIPVVQTQTGFAYPQSLAFDQNYSYQNFTSSTLSSTTYFNTNFFKNPPTGTTGYTDYVTKTTQTPFLWTGANYQQFWTTNFEQALWATNGTPGVQMQAITTIVVVSTTKVTFTIANSPAVIGDFVFINEVVDSGMSPSANTLNGQSGYVTAVGTGTITVTFPNANIVASGTFSGGIIQYLTNVVPTTTSSSMGDGIKWYDGDPTVSSGLPSNSATGWVNFAPPLSAGSERIDIYYSGTNPFYLVGAKAIFPFKDRLLFFGAYIATSAMIFSRENPIYLQDTVVWSWNGAPYYTCSFELPNNILTVFDPILTPGTGVATIPTEGAQINAYYTDETGFGGFQSSGTKSNIISVGKNEDVLIVGFLNVQTRLVYSGNDLAPFQFYSINSELGATATFSGITLDRGVITYGDYGFALTTQTGSQRIDLQIPNQAFTINSTNFGVQRINSERDFYKEWIYFCYPPTNQPATSLFPTQTFFYNYRDETWAIFYENFTTHGSFWRYADLTWATLPYATWDEWTDPWDSGSQQALFPSVIAGNPQGFIVVKSQGTAEAATGYITNCTANSNGDTNINSINHCVSMGDYLYIQNCLGTINLNGEIGQVVSITDANNFTLDLTFPSQVYGGLGTFARLSQPLLQSKQFSSYWEQGRKIRIGAQKYLFDNSSTGEVTLNMYLSQDPDTIFNASPIYPSADSINDAVIYSQIISTAPEPLISTISFFSLGSLGNGSATTLTANLTYPLIPSSTLIQIGNVATFMDNGTGGFTVTGTGISSGSSINYQNGEVVLVFSSAPNLQPSYANYKFISQNVQNPTATNQFQIWHRMNTSLIGDTVQFGITLNDKQMRNLSIATAEITLHAASIDISPGPHLA